MGRRNWVAWTAGGAIATAAATALALVAVASVPVGNACLFVATFAVLAVGRRRLARPFLSPVWITAGLLAGVGILGELFAYDLAQSGGASVRIFLSPDVTASTGRLFAVAALVVAVTGCFAAGKPIATPPATSDTARSAPGGGRLLLGCSIPAIVLLATTDVGYLLRRSSYLAEDVASSSSVSSVATQLALGAVLVLGMMLAGKKGLYRWWAVALLIAYGSYFLAGGSRRLAMIPVLIAVGFFAVRRTRRAAVLVLVSAVVSFLLTGLPLYLRGLGEHGLLPYTAALGSYLATPTGWQAVANNVLVAFPITGATAFEQPAIPSAVLYTELNPLPGSFTDWYSYAPALRLNIFTPYSSLGELGNYGWGTLIAVLAVAGLLLGYLDRRVRTLLGDGWHVTALVVVGLTALFAVLFLQYNLRASVRLLLYAVVIDLAVRMVASHRRARAERLELVTRSP